MEQEQRKETAQLLHAFFNKDKSRVTYAKVKSVTNDACIVIVEGIEIEARLKPTQDDKKATIYLKPKVNTTVLIINLEGSQFWYIIDADELEEIQVNFKDTQGNETTFVQKNTGVTTTINDSSNNKTTFTQDSKKVTTTINDSSNNKTTFTQDSKKVTTMINDVTNNKTTFTQDSTGVTTTVNDVTNNKTTFTQDSTKITATVADIANNNTTLTLDSKDVKIDLSGKLTINNKDYSLSSLMVELFDLLAGFKVLESDSGVQKPSLPEPITVQKVNDLKDKFKALLQ